MKIAVPMRALDREGALQRHVESLLDALLAIDPRGQYLLLHRRARGLGRFAAHRNVEERVVRAPHALVWDQIAAPLHAWRWGADVLLSPDARVPLLAACPVAMALREPGAWLAPDDYTWMERACARTRLALACGRADWIFAASRFSLRECRSCLELALPGTQVLHTAPASHLQPATDEAARIEYRASRGLPARFALAVLDPGCAAEVIVRAFRALRDPIPDLCLVLVGRGVERSLRDRGLQGPDLRGIVFRDPVPDAELPLLYGCAELALALALHDGLGSAVLEPMACECPVIASTTGACPELGADAVLYASPRDPDDVAWQIQRLCSDPDLRRDLRTRGRVRAASFHWRDTAQAILDGLQRIAGPGRALSARDPGSRSPSGPSGSAA